MDKAKKISILQDLIDETLKVNVSEHIRDEKMKILWEQKVKAIIKNLFLDDKEKLRLFNNISFRPISYPLKQPTERDYRQKYAEGIEKTIGYLSAWRNELEMFDNLEQEENTTADKLSRRFSKACFIVHGHNNEVKLEVKDFINDIEMGITSIILHKKPNEGMTVLEKFETHSDVDFAICLWTADDTGKGNISKRYKSRARQNVIIETGFFWGKLGRERVIILLEDGVKIPSDYEGMLYIPLKGNWKDDLRKEILNIYRK